MVVYVVVGVEFDLVCVLCCLFVYGGYGGVYVGYWLCVLW